MQFESLFTHSGVLIHESPHPIINSFTFRLPFLYSLGEFTLSWSCGHSVLAFYSVSLCIHTCLSTEASRETAHTPDTSPPPSKCSDHRFSSSSGYLNQLGTYWMVHLKVLTPKEQPVTILEVKCWVGRSKPLFGVLKLEHPFWSTQYKVNWINSFILYSDANSIIQKLI